MPYGYENKYFAKPLEEYRKLFTGLKEGVYVLEIVAIDGQGNRYDSDEIVFAMDTKPPTVGSSSLLGYAVPLY